MKKIITFWMALCLILGGLYITPKAVVRAYDDDEDEVEVEEYQKDSTEGFKEIRTAADLAGIANAPSANYVLMNDIDLSETKQGGKLDSGNGWKPIPNFSGILDGNGHYIKNMNIYGMVEYAGLFAKLYGTVRNLAMINVSISVEGEYAGGIAGVVQRFNYESAQVYNCYVTGKIEGNRCSGGIAGYSDPGFFENCYNKADVKGSCSGGIVGLEDYIGCASKCINMGPVVGTKNENAITSGLYVEPTDCFYLVGCVKNEAGRATPLTAEQMKSPQFFTNFDFNNVWYYDKYSTTCDHPQLRSCPQDRIASLTVEKAPSVTTYNQGDALNIEDGVLKLVYENGYDTTIPIEKDMIGACDMMQVGVHEVPVTYGNKTVNITITVQDKPVTSLTLSQGKVSVNKGKSVKIDAKIEPDDATNKSLVWKSADENIATVSADGTVTGKAKGTTKVSATASNGMCVECEVVVTIPATKLSLTEYEIKMKSGETKAISCSMLPLDASEAVIWTSSDEAVAYYDATTGSICAVGPGKATIKAKTESGVSVPCEVTVTQDISEFTVSGLVDKKYTGKAIKQNKIVVRDGSTVLKKGVDYKVSYEDNVEAGTATIIIKGIGVYTGEIEDVFDIIGPKELDRVKITSVKAAKAKLTISWKKVSGAKKYQVEVSPKKTFKGAGTIKKTVSGVKVAIKAKAKTTYYVRVKAKAGSNVGEYSAIKKKKTK